jgi:hypothetical protein
LSLFFQVVYTILVVLLISKYTRTDGGAWFILFQAAYVALVFVLRQLFPEFVDRAKDIGAIRAARPLVAGTEPIALYVLGTMGEKYSEQGAAFDFIFWVLLGLNVLKYVAFSEVTGTNGFFVKSV